MAETQDTGAPEAAPAALVAAAPVEGSGDVSSAAAETLSPTGLADRLTEAVKKWVSEHFYNSPVSRATEALNYLNQTAVPDLVQQILKEID